MHLARVHDAAEFRLTGIGYRRIRRYRDDFTKLAAELIQHHEHGVRIETICGPEDLNGLTLASRIAKRHRALPLPLWWSVVAVALKTLHKLGFTIVKPDQLTRLTGKKTGSAADANPAREGARRFPAN